MHKYYIIFISLFIVASSGCGKAQLTDAEYLQRAREHLAKQEIRAAIIEAKNALQLNGNNAEARRFLAEQYLLTGDGSAAEKELRRALELGMGDARTRYMLGKALLLQGKNTELLNELKIDEATQDSAVAPLLALRGEAHLGAQQNDQARAQIERASALSAQAPEVMLAVAKLAIATAEYAQATQVLEQLVRMEPENQEAAYLSAAVLFSQRRYEEAATAFQNVLSRGPRNTPTLWSFEARIGFLRVQLATGKEDAALAEAEQLVKSYPDHPVPHYYRALIAYQKRDYATARDHLQQVLNRVPDHTQSLLLIGAVYYAQQSYEQANDYLSRFVAVVPSHIQARKLLAAVRLRLNRPKDAIEALESAEEATTDDAELLAMIGRAVLQSGDVKKGSAYLQRAAGADPDSPSIRAELAKAYMAQGAYDDALRELGSISGSAQVQAKAMMVYAHLQKKDIAAARNLARELIAGTPDPALYTLAGIVELVAGERQAARERFADALKTNEKFIPAYLNLARMDLEDGNLPESKKSLETVLQIDRNNTPAMIGLAQLAEQRHELEQAVSWLERARAADERALVPRLVLGNYYLHHRELEKAKVLAEEAKEYFDKDPRVLILLGRVNLAAGRENEALANAKQLVETWPKLPGAHLEYATVLVQLKRHSQARNALRQALQLKPDFVQAKVALALVELELKNTEQALKIARELQKEDEGIGASLEGDIHFKTKNYAQAKAMYARALTKRPLPELVMKMAAVERAMGQSTQAFATLSRWLDTHPTDARVRLALAAHYQAESRSDDAIRELRQVVELEPNNTAALNNLAWLAYTKQDPKALEYAEAAHRLVPQDGAVTDTLGWLLVQENKDLQRAVELLRDASRQAPQVPVIRYHLAVGLVKSGAKEEAKTILTALLDKPEQFAELEDARGLLRTLQ